MNVQRALVTGATGYIGARLVPALLHDGWTVRVLTRNADKIAARPWADQVEISEGSADDDDDLSTALEGVDVAYYLIHSMDGHGDFVARDRAMARRFAQTAHRQGVQRIVYLSGLFPHDEVLSKHLGSRKEVEDIFVALPVPAAVLRAAVILGAGSASFEMLRHLTDRLPVMIAPRWLDTLIEPIAIADVIRYLVGAAQLPAEVNRGFDIGAGEVLTYRQLIDRYAAQSQLIKRRVRTLPVMTPGLASHWVGLVTPVPASIAKPLVGSLVHEVVAKEHDIAQYVPDPDNGFIGIDAAVVEAQEGPQATNLRHEVDSDAPGRISAADPQWSGATVFSDVHEGSVQASKDDMWSAIERSGGDSASFGLQLLWRVRGLADRAIGGPGHPNRRDAGPLTVDSRVGSWVVTRVSRTPDEDEVTLQSTMKLPGTAELIIAARRGTTPADCVLSYTARFTPSGLLGFVYWTGAWPAHVAVFRSMYRSLVNAAERGTAAAANPGPHARR